MNTKKLTWTVAAIALTLAPAANAVTLSQVGGGVDISTSFNPSIREASGLGLAKNQTALWSITDSNCTVFKMNLDGSSTGRYPSQPSSCPGSLGTTDFEGITYAPPLPGITDDHYVYIANENGNSIVPFNYNTLQYGTPIPLSGMSGYNSSSVHCGDGNTVSYNFANPGDPNSGLEGITWDGSHFFVIKEKDPGLILELSSDLTQILACKTLSLPNATDYSDISYDSTRGLFWIASDEAQYVYLYDWSTNSRVQSWHFTSSSMANMEGIAFNPDNSRLYITTDNGLNSDSYMYTFSVQ
jgi:uncharacterized protein YjiK